MNNPTFADHLSRYAELVIRVALNITEGRSLYIKAGLDTAPFVRLVASRAYQAGARQVYVDWTDEELQRITVEQAPEASLHEYMEWRSKGLEMCMEEGWAYLQVYSPNPDLLSGLPPERVAAHGKTAARASQGFRSYLYKEANIWALVSVPTPAWAAKVFPDRSAEEAVEALWDAIFQVNRVYEADPVTAWESHLSALSRHVDYLNGKRYKALRYRGPGTDLRIELPEGHLWMGASGRTATDGVRFLPNMPTEEVFTLPHKKGVSGTVSSTLPLNYNGALIDGFTLTFEAGRIVGWTARTGEEALKGLIEMDAGSCYLGEVALVPHRSPISDLGVIFYNTLYDENASCHLAIGNAYPYTLQGGTGLPAEELEARGANVSLTHVDFMIGSGALDIDGETENGTLEPLFRQGNWAV